MPRVSYCIEYGYVIPLVQSSDGFNYGNVIKILFTKGRLRVVIVWDFEDDKLHQTKLLKPLTRSQNLKIVIKELHHITDDVNCKYC